MHLILDTHLVYTHKLKWTNTCVATGAHGSHCSKQPDFKYQSRQKSWKPSMFTLDNIFVIFSM